MDNTSHIKKVMVAIRCITYNHEAYIRDALEGFIMQKTNFPFVAIVHDDASTDGTADIIREYAAKYPDIIKPIYETENQYSKHDGSLRRIMTAACESYGAKYYALCEGDDYWTDPLKLQKQVDFLETHPDYSMCFHNAIVHYENSDIKDQPFSILNSKEYCEEELSSNWLGATASFVFRKTVYDSNFYKKVAKSNRFIVGDYPLLLCCIRSGRIFAFEECMSVYRINPGGWTQQKHSAYKFIQMEKEVVRIFGGTAALSAKKNAVKNSRESISMLIHGHPTEAYKTFYSAFQLSPLRTIIANIKFILSLIGNKLIQKR